MAPAIEETEQRLKALSLVVAKGRPISTLYDPQQEPLDRKIFVTPNDELHKAATDFAEIDHWCWYVLTKHQGTEPTHEQIKWMLEQLDYTALEFREAIENFIFGASFGLRLRRKLAKQRRTRRQELKQLLKQIDPGQPSTCHETSARMGTDVSGDAGHINAGTVAVDNAQSAPADT